MATRIVTLEDLQHENQQTAVPLFAVDEETIASYLTQTIPCRNVNPIKLTTLLRVKFGIGAFDVHMMHNSYSLKAPRMLTQNEIAMCRNR